MPAISYIRINGKFAVVAGYKCGVINNRAVITTNLISNQNINNRNNNNPDIQVENREIHFHPCSIQLTNNFF